jgi:hypothetical protein
LLDEVEKLKTTPIADEELKRVLNQAEAQYVYGKDSVQSQGRQLGEDAMRGDWRYGEMYLENLRRVTAADVQRVAQKYFVERNRTVGYFEPIAAGTAAPAGAVPQAPPVTAATAPVSTQNTVALQSSPGATNALSTRQAVSAKAGRLAVKPTRIVLDNGVTVIVKRIAPIPRSTSVAHSCRREVFSTRRLNPVWRTTPLPSCRAALAAVRCSTSRALWKMSVPRPV